jgi:positive regulator of sigma E activity
MSYRIEVIPGLALLGTALLLLLVPPVALIAVILVATAGLAAVVALAGAVLAMPYLLARYIHRRLANRHRPTETTVPITSASFSVLTEPTTAGR